MDLIGDLGGVTELFKFLIGLFINPISNFAFVLQASKLLFHARTTDSEMFKEKTELEPVKNIGNIDEKQLREINKHKEIRINFLDKIKLFLSIKVKLIPHRCFKKKQTFQKLY